MEAFEVTSSDATNVGSSDSRARFSPFFDVVSGEFSDFFSLTWGNFKGEGFF